MFVTVSPPRKRLLVENAAPFGWRRNSGFWALWLSSSVIRLSRFVLRRTVAAAEPGSSIAVGVNARVSAPIGFASTISPKRS